MFVCQVSQRLTLSVGHFSRQRILLVVKNQRFCLVVYLRFQIIQINLKAIRGIEISIRHSNAVVEFDLALINRKPRVRIQNFVSRIHHRAQELSDNWFAAGLHCDVLWSKHDVALLAKALGKSKPERCDACVWAITSFAFCYCSLHRRRNIGRRRKVQVAEVKRKHFVAL